MKRVTFSSRARKGGFTLIEVAIASVILAVALFAILQICAVCLRGTRLLSRVQVDASSLAAELSMELGPPKDEEGDFGKVYPEYSWSRRVVEIENGNQKSTGLYLVNFEVVGRNKNGKDDHSVMSIIMYRPGGTRRVGR